MRIWDIDPKLLCRNHLLGEHNELHAIWNIITRGKKGYSHHPETARWKGRLRALFDVHQKIVQEMESRGYRHHSPLDRELATGMQVQDVFVDSIARQREILREKGCSCALSPQKATPDTQKNGAEPTDDQCEKTSGRSRLHRREPRIS